MRSLFLGQGQGPLGVTACCAGRIATPWCSWLVAFPAGFIPCAVVHWACWGRASEHLLLGCAEASPAWDTADPDGTWVLRCWGARWFLCPEHMHVVRECVWEQWDFSAFSISMLRRVSHTLGTYFTRSF